MKSRKFRARRRHQIPNHVLHLPEEVDMACPLIENSPKLYKSWIRKKRLHKKEEMERKEELKSEEKSIMNI